MTSIEREEVAALLDRAAARVERGWCRGCAALSDTGPVKALHPQACKWSLPAAITVEVYEVYASGNERLDAIVRSAVRETVGEYFLAHWSDAPGRTQSEVVAALRETARRVREGE